MKEELLRLQEMESENEEGSVDQNAGGKSSVSIICSIFCAE